MRSYLKNNFIISIIIILFIVGCKKENINEPIDNTNNTVSLSGSIDEWNLGNDMILKLGTPTDNMFSEYSSASIKNDGSFEISFLSPAQHNFIPIVEIEDIENNVSLSISNPNIKGILASFYIFESESATPTEILNHRLDISGDSVRVYQIDFVYCEDELSIIGEYVEDDKTKVYDLHFKKGWNKRVFKYQNRYEYTSVEPSGYKWLIGK